MLTCSLLAYRKESDHFIGSMSGKRDLNPPRHCDNFSELLQSSSQVPRGPQVPSRTIPAQCRPDAAPASRSLRLGDSISVAASRRPVGAHSAGLSHPDAERRRGVGASKRLAFTAPGHLAPKRNAVSEPLFYVVEHPATGVFSEPSKFEDG